MKGFKDSTKVQYDRGGCDGYAKGGRVKGAAKVAKVMREFKKGELHSGSKAGPKVNSRDQAVAIALNEARKAGKKTVRKQDGGAVGRAQRTQREEAREDAKLMREVPARPTRGNTPDYTAEPAEARRARRQRTDREAAPRRGPAGAGFVATPLVERPLEAARNIARRARAPKMLQKGLGAASELTVPRRPR